MKKRIIMKCSNCSSTDLKSTTIGWICATEGRFDVNAYACQKCGHIELFKPNLDIYYNQIRKEQEIKQKKEELKSKRNEEKRQKRIKELMNIINNMDSTLREINNAKKELKQIEPRYHDGYFEV